MKRPFPVSHLIILWNDVLRNDQVKRLEHRLVTGIVSLVLTVMCLSSFMWIRNEG